MRLLVRRFRCGLGVFGAWLLVAAGLQADPTEELLLRLCDRLLTVQITDPSDPDCGALRCPSDNPEPHPLHSRAAEAVYPLAVVFERTGREEYRRAAIALGDWLVSIQQPGGAWGESWPGHDGWVGTTADQLISLAGAYPRLESALMSQQREAWRESIRRAARFVHARFPMGNLNYWSTGAVGLEFAARVLPDEAAGWREKAKELIERTLTRVNADGLLVGEGGGVDMGYNLAQTIGFLALYGRLTDDEALLTRAATLLEAHLPFVYPTGLIDNSWGTRSYKWTYESGTKTAPGVPFTFELLAERDARFAAAAQRTREYLLNHALVDDWVVQGPHASRRTSAYPPCLYGTFARAQSLAMAVAHRASAEPVPVTDPDESPPWIRHFPSVQVAVVRTGGLMATVAAYGEISQLPRTLVTRGGSLTQLWVGDFGREGVLQTSSVTEYRRQEAKHLPNEGALLPLTPRLEVTEGDAYWTNLYEADARLEVRREGERIIVVTTGELRDREGRGSGLRYRLEHRFEGSVVTKRISLTSDRPIEARLVEPIVRAEGLVVDQVAPQQIRLTPGQGRPWLVAVDSSQGAVSVRHGEDAERYWCPFPAVEAYPIVASGEVTSEQPLEWVVEFRPAERL